MIVHMSFSFYGMVWIYLNWTYEFFENVSAQIFLPGMSLLITLWWKDLAWNFEVFNLKTYKLVGISQAIKM